MHIDHCLIDGNYIDETGCTHTSAKDYIQNYMFDFCGCGDPDSVLIYVRDSLRCIRILHENRENPENFDKQYKLYKEECKKVFNSTGSEYFMFYWLDNKGYTEHGGSVPGWLTQEGKELLEDLEEICSTIL